jgi:uncharacterized protein YggE
VAPKGDDPGREAFGEKAFGESLRKETTVMPAYGLRVPTEITSQVRTEGVTVTGEAVRRVAPESAEFLIEVTASAATAAQALRDNQVKTTQVTQAVGPMGVQPADIQTISLNLYNLYAPMMQALPAYGAMPQIQQGPLAPSYGGGQELQFGSYQARNTIRVNVREPGRVGEIVDAAARAGATIVGAFSFRAADEANARKGALEAAGKDARARAESLATAAGKQLGDPVTLTEEIMASNGAFMALRSAMPFAFGAGAPQVVGELEYYARVSATFRLQ